MQLEHAEAMALAYMTEHKLYRWQFKFDEYKSRFGACHYRKRTITLSSHLIPSMPVDEVRDTILHEIAHALDFMRHGSSNHGPRWKAICREIGARPVRCGKTLNVEKIESPYLLKCTSDECGKVYPRYRKTRTSYICGKCRHDMVLVHSETKEPVYR